MWSSRSPRITPSLSFSVVSNENNQIREVNLGDEICSLKYLKNLTVQAYGLTQLPANFINLGKSLESLNLVSNNFNKLSDITDIVNEKNFPKLRNLILYAQRRTDVLFDIASLGGMNASGVYVYNNYPIGLYGKVNAGTPDRDRKSTRLNSSHVSESRMPSSA